MSQVHEDGPFVLGVTGNIACGKSAVLQMLADLGAETIDADKVYHALIEPERPLWQSLVNRFGQEILDERRRIDRRKLGAIVFRDPAALAELERLTHPAIHEAILQWIADSSSPVLAIDAVKLIEGGFDQFCDRVWLVTCTPEEQRSRLMRRNGLSSREAAQRIAAQPPLAPKIERADLVIDNSGSLDATKSQVLDAWRQLPFNIEVSGDALDDASLTADRAPHGRPNRMLTPNLPKVRVLRPEDRHYLRKVKEGRLKKRENSVIMPDVDVAADISAINRGEAVRQGEDYHINGRRYRIKPNGRAYPVDGDGVVPLDRGAYRALQVYNSYGITAVAERQLEQDQIDPGAREVARRVWREGQRRR